MSKEMLTFCDIEIEKKIYRHKSPVPLMDVEIEKVLLVKKAINTLLVTSIMIIKLIYYI